MAEEKKPTLEELRALIGVRGGETAVEVDKSIIRSLCNCIGDPSPKWRDIAPPSLLLGARFLGEGVKITWPYAGLVDAGAEYEFYKPIKPGDVITTTSELADVQDKSSAKGPRALISFKATHKNQKGEVVAISTSKVMSFE